MTGLLLNLNRDEWFVALTFGVVIDLDHIFAAPRYVGDNGWGAILKPTWDDGSGHEWRSLLHEPVGFFIVAPLSIGWRYMLPLLFWGTHVAIDELQLATIEHSAAIESFFLIAVVAMTILVGYRRWADVREEADFSLYLSHLRSKMRSWIGGRGASIRARLGST